MLLLLDAGNTRLKWAIADKARTIAESGAIEYFDFDDVLQRLAVNQCFTAVLVSSVAGDDRNRLLTEICKKHLNHEPEFVCVNESDCGIQNNYQALDRLGVDRWVAAMGAANRVGVNRIIVDAGTAVTIDIVDADNTFLGGVILPGSKLMHDSLVGETAGIDSMRQPVSSVVGTTTVECVNSGVLYGLAGAIDRVIAEIFALKSDDRPWQVLLCGGDANWVQSQLKTELPKTHTPHLLFLGLLNLHAFGGV